MTSIRTRITKKSNRAAILNDYTLITKQIIARGGNLVRNTAVKSIQQHKSSGVTYTRSNPSRTHTASTEGNPPNSDTGFLANNINLVIDNDGLGAEVESRAEYSVYLEFGTSEMGARPFLQPALEENKLKIRNLFKRLRAKKK